MRELSNIESDPGALHALSAEIVDYASSTRHLLIPSTDQLTDAVLLLRRLVLISHKVLPSKSYFNLLRDLQRIALTSQILAEDHVKDLPAGTPEEVQQKEQAFARVEGQFKAALAAHPVGKVEGEQVASVVRRSLCTEDVFCAACAFLQLEVSRRGSIYYIRGESPEFSETKKTRDPLSLDNETNLKTLASNLARPDAERGVVEQQQITYGFNLLTKLYQLFAKMPLVVQWIKEGEHLANPRRMIDVRAHFNLTLREYDTLMVMARQMGLTSLKSRKSEDTTKYTLNADIEARVLAEAKRLGYGANRALNSLLHDFFMMLDTQRRMVQAQREQASRDHSQSAPSTPTKEAPHGKASRKRSS